MHITLIVLLISIIGLVMSLFVIGVLPSLVSLIWGIYLFVNAEEKTISGARIIAISTAGFLLPIIMYLNTFGFSLPKKDNSDVNFYQQILSTNYSNLGIDIFNA